MKREDHDKSPRPHAWKKLKRRAGLEETAESSVDTTSVKIEPTSPVHEPDQAPKIEPTTPSLPKSPPLLDMKKGKKKGRARSLSDPSAGPAFTPLGGGRCSAAGLPVPVPYRRGPMRLTQQKAVGLNRR